MKMIVANARIEELDSRTFKAFTPTVVDLLTQLSSRGEAKILCQTKRSIESKDNFIFIARSCGDPGQARGDGIIGVGMLTILDIFTKRVGYINDVIVHQSHRSHGVGRSITERMIRKAEELGCDCVDLTSSPKRISAHNLYSSLGFQKRNTIAFRLTLGRVDKSFQP
jgi:ribosomal protein S18 acetylase RimI-like enzyme